MISFSKLIFKAILLVLNLKYSQLRICLNSSSYSGGMDSAELREKPFRVIIKRAFLQVLGQVLFLVILTR